MRRPARGRRPRRGARQPRQRSPVASTRVAELVPGADRRLASSRATSATPTTSTARSPPPTSTPSCTSPGCKAVGESVEVPLALLRPQRRRHGALLEAMARHGVRDLVFSSSCTVYGDPTDVPDHRGHARSAATSPYGRTKLHIEEMLRDVAGDGPAGGSSLLRYFNPVGAHPSGRIGEDPIGIPNNLMPYVMQVAVGRRDHLTVFGGDYPTPDGTGDPRLHPRRRPRRGPPRRARPRSTASRVPSRSTSAPAPGTRCSRSSRAASEAVGPRHPLRDRRRRRPATSSRSWADPARARELLGWQASRARSPRCAPTTGAGSRVQPRRLRRQLTRRPEASGQPAGMLAATAAQTSR